MNSVQSRNLLDLGGPRPGGGGRFRPAGNAWEPTCPQPLTPSTPGLRRAVHRDAAIGPADPGWRVVLLRGDDSPSFRWRLLVRSSAGRLP